MPLPGMNSRKFVRLKAFSACMRNSILALLADVGLLGEAEIPLLLPGSVEQDALAELAGLVGGSDVGRVGIQVGQGLAVDFKRGVGIVDQRLRQIVAPRRWRGWWQWLPGWSCGSTSCPATGSMVMLCRITPDSFWL